MKKIISKLGLILTTVLVSAPALAAESTSAGFSFLSPWLIIPLLGLVGWAAVEVADHDGDDS